MPDEFRVVVEKVIRGKHGPYAVARQPALGVITFSLDQSVWQEAYEPEPGTHVILSQLMKKTAGWRAMQARGVRPTDEKATSKE